MDKITKPARIGHTTFSVGVSVDTVMNRAYREYEHFVKTRPTKTYRVSPMEILDSALNDSTNQFDEATCAPDCKGCEFGDPKKQKCLSFHQHHMGFDPAAGDSERTVMVVDSRRQGKSQRLKQWVAEMREKHPGIQIFFRPGPGEGFEEVSDEPPL